LFSLVLLDEANDNITITFIPDRERIDRNLENLVEQIGNHVDNVYRRTLVPEEFSLWEDV
jgi:hypothetical protein